MVLSEVVLTRTLPKTPFPAVTVMLGAAEALPVKPIIKIATVTSCHMRRKKWSFMALGVEVGGNARELMIG